MKYVAFLRAINVGSHNRIKMPALIELFEGSGCRNVSTLLQTGNVFFESGAKGPGVATRLETALTTAGLKQVDVMVRTMQSLEALVASKPFGKPTESVVQAVCFLRDPAKAELPTVPSFEVVARTPSEVMYQLERGSFAKANPNAVIEKKLGVRGTSRFWNVVCQCAEGSAP